MNAIQKLKQAKVNATVVDVDAVMQKALDLLDSCEGTNHVDVIEDLFNPSVVKALKSEGILEESKFYSKRQAASQVWLLWRNL